MGVLLAAAGDETLRTALGLDERSTVVLFGGEGATDPGIYQQIVGSSPDEILARQTAAEREGRRLQTNPNG